MLSFVQPKDKGRSKMSNVSVSMNRHALVDLAMYGQQDRVELLFRFLFAATKRIGKPIVGRAFRRVPPGVGAPPNIHDVKRWLDSLDSSEEKTEEVAFLFRVFNTVRARVRPEVIEGLEKGTDPHALI
jgi:hypothetical protein